MCIKNEKYVSERINFIIIVDVKWSVSKWANLSDY